MQPETWKKLFIGFAVVLSLAVIALILVLLIDPVFATHGGANCKVKSLEPNRTQTTSAKSVATGTIPRVLHFMWLDKKDSAAGLPVKYLPNVESFRRHNPDFAIKVWTLDDLNALFDKFPEELKHAREASNEAKRWITKCDIGRFCVLWAEGGIYSDLDFWCRRSLDDLTTYTHAVLAREPPENEFLTRKLYNGFAAAPPRDAFVSGWIGKMVTNLKSPRFKVYAPNQYVMKTTGPTALHAYAMQLGFHRGLSVVNFCDVLPLFAETSSKKFLRFGRRPTSLPEARGCNFSDCSVYTLWNEGTDWVQGRKTWDVHTIVMADETTDLEALRAKVGPLVPVVVVTNADVDVKDDKRAIVLRPNQFEHLSALYKLKPHAVKLASEVLKEED